jgi:hypothetical protein
LQQWANFKSREKEKIVGRILHAAKRARVLGRRTRRTLPFLMQCTLCTPEGMQELLTVKIGFAYDASADGQADAYAYFKGIVVSLREFCIRKSNFQKF